MKKSKRILAGAALAMMIAAGGHAETWQWGELDPDHMFTVLYGPPSMFEDPEHDEVLPAPGFVDGLPSDFEGLYGPPPFDPAPVEWNNGSTFAEQGTKTDPDGVIVYQDDGQSQGLSGKKNYLSNPGFEKKDGAWRLFPLGTNMELGILENKETAFQGGHLLYFRAQEENSAEMRLEQRLTNLPDGNYRFAIAAMGMNAGEQEIYAYVLVNGKMAAKAPIVISDSGVWETGETPSVAIGKEDIVTVGVYARCSGADAFGAFDAAKLIRE